MIADFFTKPLQGAAFLRFRNLILNIDDSPFDKEENHRSVLCKPSPSHNTVRPTMTIPLPSARQAGNGKDTIDDQEPKHPELPT